MKLKKRRKSKKMRGVRTHGHSAKLNKGKGSRGGVGMSGTGKRGDQKKTRVLNLKGKYFGKQGITSKKSEVKKGRFINLKDIDDKFKEGEVCLEKYKILGSGEVSKKFIIKAKAASKAAIERVKKAGGEIILPAQKTTQKKEANQEKKETTLSKRLDPSQEKKEEIQGKAEKAQA